MEELEIKNSLRVSKLLSQFLEYKYPYDDMCDCRQHSLCFPNLEWVNLE